MESSAWKVEHRRIPPWRSRLHRRARKPRPAAPPAALLWKSASFSSRLLVQALKRGLFYTDWDPCEAPSRSGSSLEKISCLTASLSRCSDLLHLAVLHPRKLSVYSVSGRLQAPGRLLLTRWPSPSPPLCSPPPGTAGNVEHGDQYQLKLLYEHNLQRTACCMAHGTFGGVSGAW